MPRRGPHISLPRERLVTPILGFSADDLRQWPAAVRELAADLAGELFLIRYNPFIDPELVRLSVGEAMDRERPTLDARFFDPLAKAVESFWKAFDEDQAFKAKVVERLQEIVPESAIESRGRSLIETSTDATDLRLELPMLLVSPSTEVQIQSIVRLAGEMGFAIIPRGGGTGATGGAIPAARRTVVLSLSKLKDIRPIDTENKVLCAQAGVLTLNAIEAAKKAGLHFTVDPASKAASSIGGNISENSGGPMAFEYGVTLDNLLSYRMVLPDGQLVEVRRKDHPWHKIMEDETAVYEVVGADGQVRDTIELSGDAIRGKSLGKDVTNKYLGGLPGMQKEGVDGIIVEGCFTLHPLLAQSRTVCLEFFGRSMKNAMYVINEVVALRDKIRTEGDKVKISALEEWGIKYVHAIGYEAKSTTYEGLPISVLLLQLDSDDVEALEAAVAEIEEICKGYDQVDAFVATDDKEAEHFWEDRHKLSAIAKRTSGFKINEDIVIPLARIPDFADFLEDLNLYYAAKAYSKAVKAVGELPGVPATDKTLDKEIILAMKVLRGDMNSKEMTDQEMETQAAGFFQNLEVRYPQLKDDLARIYTYMQNSRIVIANHMHAGDGNCHVNLPVNSNDADMMHNAHEAAGKVFATVLEMGGAVTGEHGIGITKIAFLGDDKMAALRDYKERVDPKNIINPHKLVTRTTPGESFTFSFNSLIQDLTATALPDKERLIKMLTDIQICTRCGKCKQVCPMYDPSRNLMFHPRNKNISLGALVEGLYYSQMVTGKPSKDLMRQLQSISEHCTACGKCMGVCPVKIDTAEVTLFTRAFLSSKKVGGHPVKSLVLDYLAKDPAVRAPIAAKLASAGQSAQNLMIGTVPARWRQKLENPALAEKGPDVTFRNLAEAIKLNTGNIFVPNGWVPHGPGKAVFYFPGCGASLFSRTIGLAAIDLLIRAGVAVVLPPQHLCCGYPLLAQGMEDAYLANQDRNLPILRESLAQARVQGINVSAVLTSCGTCREALQKFSVEMLFGMSIAHQDVAQYLLTSLDTAPCAPAGGNGVIYHAACHAEWTGVPSKKAAETYRATLETFSGSPVSLSPGCCGESGLGALTSPTIYNRIRTRKLGQLKRDLAACDGPIVVGCPSCKSGIARSLLALNDQRRVLHTLEFMAEQSSGTGWVKDILKRVHAAKADTAGIRAIGPAEAACV